MQIDPKITFWFGVWTNILMLIGGGTIKFAGLLSDPIAFKVTGWCLFTATINSVILTALTGYSSNAKGPLVNTPTVPPVVKTAAVLALCVIVGTFAFGPSPAMAQGKKPAPPPFCDPLKLLPGCAVATTGGALISIEQVIKNIGAAQDADLAYAKALADNAATPGSKLRSACLAAIIAAKAQVEGAALKKADGTVWAKPEPGIISTMEQGAELVDDLQPTAPLVSGCAAAANAAAQNVLTVVNGIATGALLKAATGGVL
jgi:hypothetical protein